MSNEKTLTRAFGSPLKYIQGPNEFDSLPEYIGIYGKNAVALFDGFLFQSLSERLGKDCEGTGIACHMERFNGECCKKRSPA